MVITGSDVLLPSDVHRYCLYDKHRPRGKIETASKDSRLKYLIISLSSAKTNTASYHKEKMESTISIESVFI